jgi:hypothetical protein
MERSAIREKRPLKLLGYAALQFGFETALAPRALAPSKLDDGATAIIAHNRHARDRDD